MRFLPPAVLLLLQACTCREPDPVSASPAPLPAVAVPTYVPLDATDSLEQQLQNRHEDLDQVLAVLALREGMVVADVGAGAGYFEPHLARAVGPTGRVVATDVKEALIRRLDQRLASDPSLDPAHVVTLQVNPPGDPQLEPASVDVLLLAHLDFFLYHPLPDDLAGFLRACGRALAPEGRVVVVQWMGVRSGYTDRHGHTQTPSEQSLLRNFAEAGFQHERTVDGRPPEHPVVRTSPDVPGPLPDQYNTRIFVFGRGT